MLALEQFMKISALLEIEWKSHTWLSGWRNWLNSKCSGNWFSDWAGIALIVGLPVFVTYLLLDADSGFIVWLIQLAISLFILIYSLTPIDQNKHLGEYFNAVEREDLQGAYHHIEEYLDLKSSHPMPNDLPELGRLVTRLIVSQSNFRFFAVLFYFVLLGPAAALFYRLVVAFEFTERDNEESLYWDKLKVLRGYLDWIPLRATCFLYALAGDFTGVMSKLNTHLFSGDIEKNDFIEEAGLGALGIKTLECDEIIEENNQALDLVSRSAMILLVIIAVLTLFGWLS